MKTPHEMDCPICLSGETEEFLHRTGVSVHQNLLCKSPAEARQLARGELVMRICLHCGFVYNAAFDPSQLEYGKQYDNTQTHSETLQTYVDQVIGRLAKRTELRRGTVVEVGCGKGGFLRRLITSAGPECRGHGFDPAYEGEENGLEGRLRFHRCFYEPKQAELAADVVVSRHVIEHVPLPMTMLRSIRRALSGSPNARVCFETPCVRWILENQVVWDFFYEHCSLFTADSLATAFTLAGFKVESVEHVFGGQYLWLEAVLDEDSPLSVKPKSREVIDLARNFTRRETQLADHWRSEVVRYASEGEVVVWGGGAKGVTFANLVDRDRSDIAAIVDVNPNKQGHFLPGSGHPIVAPEWLVGRSIKTAILLNPNYADEIRSELRSLGLEIELVDFMREAVA